MKNKNKTKKGFSLVELIIYMGLLSLLMVILSQIFTAIIQAKLNSESTSSIDQNADYLISRLTYDVSRSQAVNIPATLTPCTTACTLQLNIGGNTYTYTINGSSNMQVTTNAGTDVLNGYDTSISNLKIARIGNGASPLNTDSIRLNFVITSRTLRSSGNETRSYELTVAQKK